MNWITLNNNNQLEQIIEESAEKPVLIFKHSTRCSISATALSRLERKWQNQELKPYFLDLLKYRDISNKIAEIFGIEHESPQALLIYKGQSLYDASHLDIDYNEIVNEAGKILSHN